MKEETNVFQKLPWGIFAGVLFVLLFYVTIGIVAAYLIFNAIAGATSASITLFTYWWQTMLFVLDVVFIIGFVFSLIMYVLKLNGAFKKIEV